MDFHRKYAHNSLLKKLAKVVKEYCDSLNYFDTRQIIFVTNIKDIKLLP